MKFASRTLLPRSTNGLPAANRVRLPRCSPAPGARALAMAAVLRPTPAGKSFGRKRIEHAVEAAGACIMMAVFLLLALLA